MASIFKVVAVYDRWSLFRVVVRLVAHLGQQDSQLSWPIMFCGRRLAALIFGGRRQSAVGGWRTAVGGRRTAVGGRRTAALICSAAGGANVRRPAVG